MSVIRLVAIGLLSLLAIVQIARQAVVSAFAKTHPAYARATWGAHPDVAFKFGLEAIAAAAAEHRSAPRARIQDMLARARWSPLSPEPFLVRGVDLRLSANEGGAGRAFAAALRRDPRSIAARYFLADHYLRSGQGDKGLTELAMLTRLVPNSISGVAPYYAAFASRPGGAARIKAMLDDHPEFEPVVLAALADDARNADLILFLSSGRKNFDEAPPGWQGRLVQALVAAGQYEKARTVWSRIAGTSAATASGALLFDPEFSHGSAPPPFGWTLVSNGSAVAEAQAGGRLHLIYFGRDNIVLASQLLLLKPGRYRLTADVERSIDATSIAWRLTCRPTDKPILSLRLGKRGEGNSLTGAFAVAGDCPAQLLELAGTSPEFPETVDLTLANLRLTRVAS